MLTSFFLFDILAMRFEKEAKIKQKRLIVNNDNFIKF